MSRNCAKAAFSFLNMECPAAMLAASRDVEMYYEATQGMVEARRRAAREAS